MERTYAAQVRGADEIKVCGFVENIRNKSKMAFIVLKDITGKVQITVEKGEDEALDNAVNQITLDSVITVIGKAVESDTAAVYLRVKSIDDPAFSHLLLVATMFEGKVPLKIRIADTGKLWGGFCLDHPAFLKECREWLGPENVVVRRKEKSE